ncbi:MAG: SNF2-related protein [Verrucomicrobia bacterium]|nr:SNF2-related protein [Verrucomicrobiota bacterium]
MSLPFTRKRLLDWAGEQVLRDAEAMVERGLVLNANFESPHINGTIRWNNRDLRTSMRILASGMVESQCPCYANVERGVICAHVIALALTIVHRAADPLREAKYREELRHASRLAAIHEDAFIRRAAAETPGAMPANIRLTLNVGWQDGIATDNIPMLCEAEYGGTAIPLDEVPLDVPLIFSKQDESVLFVLEDISEGPARGSLMLKRTDFINILRLMVGRSLCATDGSPLPVLPTPLTTHVRMDLDRETGELILLAHTELPFQNGAEPPLYIAAGRAGWVQGAGNFWPLAQMLPGPYHGIYLAPVIIPRPGVLTFIRQELPTLANHARIESDITADLFSVDPAEPVFRLIVNGSQASLSATLSAHYGPHALTAGRRDPVEIVAIPDPNDLLRYTVRNVDAEREALKILARHGLHGEVGDALASIVGKREVLNFLGSALPALRRRGWRVELNGRISGYMDEAHFVAPVVHVRGNSANAEGGWFDVGFDFEAPDGASLSPQDIHRAILKGDSFVEHRGRTLFIDTDAVTAMQDVFADCASGDSNMPGYFRLSNIYAPFVKSSLDALDGVDVEQPADWRRRAEQQNRTLEMEPVVFSPEVERTLRSYQKEGVCWLRFLEKNGFCGLLADEMGLGKTIQTLAWLQLERHHPAARGKPCLIICPTSIVENWAVEAARFAPDISVMTMAGPERHDHWAEVPTKNLVITSYALMRRDLDHYLAQEFSVLVLDEAQHIKNRSTQNALAAKKLRANHRVVLTGTPVENSVSDLWSIMDFLMPNYMGPPDAFRNRYELPIASGGADAVAAQSHLRRKMHPFLLRRLKAEVAKELPPKIERIAPCSLTADQRLVYGELLQQSRRKIQDMVTEKGFQRSRMEILTTLMRLRQVCCHLDLLKLEGLKAEHPSAKMDLFFELLDEAMDGGHRVLVFSQFVTMLTILRKELEQREIAHCYLDGATKERLKVVQTFNTRRDIPVFLISLKAGGSGLNLTGADTVIHFDPWWNPAVENQATDRAYRIGQRRTVYSIKLITVGTVEEKVVALQARKQAVIDATIENDEAMIQRLTWEDIQELLSL